MELGTFTEYRSIAMYFSVPLNPFHKEIAFSEPVQGIERFSFLFDPDEAASAAQHHSAKSYQFCSTAYWAIK